VRTNIALLVLLGTLGCPQPRGTEPPPEGWANSAPIRVAQIFDREDSQLLRVKQGPLETWVEVPPVRARVGDYILLGQGSARTEVEIPELGQRVPQVVDIAHARPVDLETAKQAVISGLPEGAVPVKEVFRNLDSLAEREIIVYGTVTKVAGAIGWSWVHLKDSTGEPSAAEYDLTVQTREPPIEGKRVAYKGLLRADVDLGFGYHYDALVEEAVYVERSSP